MKNLVILFVVSLFAPFANAEWVSGQREDPFDPLLVHSFTNEITKTRAMWSVDFYALEGLGLSDIVLTYRRRSPPWCNRKGLKVKSKVDGKLTPVDVKDVSGSMIILNDAEYWYSRLSRADHWLVRVTDGCGYYFDMEFDVSGTPDLRPVHPK